jgi:predicted nuclease of predicted toxin-antitoxin system
MRFLADENFPGSAVAALRASGHDVVWITISAPGSSDPEVLRQASQERRILLTFDKDFGELAKASSLPNTCGIVLLRIPPPAPGRIGKVIADLILARDDLRGHFSVIEPGRIRMRPLNK